MYRICLVAVLMAMITSPTLGDEQLDRVTKQIEEAWTKCEGTRIQFKQPGSGIAVLELGPSAEGKKCVRWEVTPPGKKAPAYTSLWDKVGTMYTVEVRSDGKTVATKHPKRRSRLLLGGSNRIQLAEADSLLRYIGTDKVNDEDCWVIEATPKADLPKVIGAPEITKRLLYFSKRCGVVVKIQAVETNGKESLELDLEKIDASASIPASRFEFKLPEGAEFRDDSNR